ncbi:alpha/beta fold hydrolase [Microbacterium sp. CJ88]|uniref:alpha/beta fold hydrolase n=1 Tax=Microbacterium sp. CJ88 TaxID=3445672 RepID=UPI003F65B186
MANFLLIHGAAANAGYWRFVAPRLEDEGHTAWAADLPTTVDGATFDDYADAALGPVGDASVDVVVGQSIGAFTAGVVASRVRPRAIVLVCPMIPAPHETPGRWGDDVGQSAAVAEYAASVGVSPEFDPATTFFHDVPDERQAQLWAEGEPPQSESIFAQEFPLDAWPDIPTRVIAGELDRMFPLALQRRVARERLGVEVEPIPTGHLPAFARPEALAAALLQSP